MQLRFIVITPAPSSQCVFVLKLLHFVTVMPSQYFLENYDYLFLEFDSYYRWTEVTAGSGLFICSEHFWIQIFIMKKL